MTDRYGVIGHPIAHSKSPVIHRLFAETTGQDLSYDAIDIPPEQLGHPGPATLRRGLSGPERHGAPQDRGAEAHLATDLPGRTGRRGEHADHARRRRGGRRQHRRHGPGQRPAPEPAHPSRRHPHPDPRRRRRHARHRPRAVRHQSPGHHDCQSHAGSGPGAGAGISGCWARFSPASSRSSAGSVSTW